MQRADPLARAPTPDVSSRQRQAERDYKSRHAPPRPRMPSGPAFEWQVVCYSEHQLLSAPGAVRRRSARAAALTRRPRPLAAWRAFPLSARARPPPSSRFPGRLPAALGAGWARRGRGPRLAPRG